MKTLYQVSIARFFRTSGRSFEGSLPPPAIGKTLQNQFISPEVWMATQNELRGWRSECGGAMRGLGNRLSFLGKLSARFDEPLTLRE
jgi:hypothetical protein